MDVAQAILEHMRTETAPAKALQDLEIELLFSRPSWAREWLALVDQQAIKKDSVTLEQVRRLALLNNEQINVLLAKHWGKLAAATPEEKLAEVRRLNNDLRASAGDAQSGKQLFNKHCAVCHRLHNEGGTVGPDLTSANRHDRDFLLVSLVDPSSVIRKEYLSVIVRTADDRILSGIPQPSTDGKTKLVNAKGETIELPPTKSPRSKPPPPPSCRRSLQTIQPSRATRFVCLLGQCFQ